MVFNDIGVHDLVQLLQVCMHSSGSHSLHRPVHASLQQVSYIRHCITRVKVPCYWLLPQTGTANQRQLTFVCLVLHLYYAGRVYALWRGYAFLKRWASVLMLLQDWGIFIITQGAPKDFETHKFVPLSQMQFLVSGAGQPHATHATSCHPITPCTLCHFRLLGQLAGMSFIKQLAASCGCQLRGTLLLIIPMSSPGLAYLPGWGIGDLCLPLLAAVPLVLLGLPHSGLAYAGCVMCHHGSMQNQPTNCPTAWAVCS